MIATFPQKINYGFRSIVHTAKKIPRHPLTALIKEIIFPLDCPICGAHLLSQNEAVNGICNSCALYFNVEPELRCEICGKPLISEIKVCVSCRKAEEKPAFNGAFVIYPYTGVYQKLLTAYKFENHRPLAHFFAEKLIQIASDIPALLQEEWVWVPTPPQPKKIKEKGWDQVEEIARVLENKSEKKVERVLKRLASRSQKELNRENRLLNLKGRILTVKRPPRNVILFDDVFTTGSTVNVCAQALKAGGAENVFAMCLFYD
ncbi:MAG: ComF family protein [Spirochaetaceae bacterium]|jgi:ComF family protein|nr:ComF family protein [Spirochaetaceae bacterium]